MKKTIVIVLLVLLFIGGSVVFAEHGQEVASAVHAALSGSEQIGPEQGDAFGAAVADHAQGGELGKKVSEAAKGANKGTKTEAEDEDEKDENDEGNGDDQRSDVAKAVHKVLGNGLKPGDEGFGAAVADRAREGNLGQDVSAAAREANGSANAGGNPNR